MRRLLAIALLFAVLPAAAKRTPQHYRVFIPSHQNLVAQNSEVVRLGLERFADNRALDAAVERGQLSPLETSATLVFDRRVPKERRYARPWVVAFIERLSVEYYAVYGKPLKVNSAVRTVEFQRRLRRWNSNAAPATGDIQSVHTAGLAVDLQRRGLSRAQLRFLQLRLLVAQARNQVIVEEEIRRNACIHVVVCNPEEFIAIQPQEMPVPTFDILLADIPDFPLD
jgi:hypothetical protein